MDSLTKDGDHSPTYLINGWSNRYNRMAIYRWFVFVAWLTVLGSKSLDSHLFSQQREGGYRSSTCCRSWRWHWQM